MVFLNQFGHFWIAVNASFGCQLVVGQLRFALVVLDPDELGVALAAVFVTDDAHLGGVLKKADYDVTLVAYETPFGNRSWVENLKKFEGK